MCFRFHLIYLINVPNLISLLSLAETESNENSIVEIGKYDVGLFQKFVQYQKSSTRQKSKHVFKDGKETLGIFQHENFYSELRISHN